MNEVICAIEGRRSIRSYRTDPVPEEKLEAVVKAGLMAPSAMNQQSWHFVVISGKGAERYRTYCIEKLGRDPYYGAPAMILVFGKKDAIAPVCDGSLAIGNLLLAAKALGLGSCLKRRPLRRSGAFLRDTGRWGRWRWASRQEKHRRQSPEKRERSPGSQSE